MLLLLPIYLMTAIPTSQITPEMQVSVDGGVDTVVVPSESLPLLSEPEIVVEIPMMMYGRTVED
jgi:hypothetical protein